MDKYNLHSILQNKLVYDLTQTGKYMHHYLTNNFKKCGQTPSKITAGLDIQKTKNIKFTLVVDRC